MTREDVKKTFPEATDEQISAILNSHHSEMSVKSKDYEAQIAGLKTKADAFDKAEQDKLSEKEKLDKLLKEAEKAKADNLRILNRTKAEAEFVREGIKAEDYSGVLDGIVSDDEGKTLNLAKSIVNAIKATAANSAAAAKQELMQTPPPGAGSGNPPAAPDDALKAEYEEALKSGDMLRIVKAQNAITASANKTTGG